MNGGCKYQDIINAVTDGIVQVRLPTSAHRGLHTIRGFVFEL